MRYFPKLAWSALFAIMVFWTVLVAWADEQEPPKADHKAKASAAKGKADDGQQAGLLTMKEVKRMRRERETPAAIAEKAAQQGVGFEVTAAVEGQLRRMGFKPDQIAAIRDARVQPNAAVGAGKAGPVVPGKGLRTTDAQRDQVKDEITRICKLSGAELTPAPTRHFTLWAAKDIRDSFLADLKKLEKLLESRWPEPIRSGLDPRSAHLVLIKTRYEFEKWVSAMYDVQKAQYQNVNGLSIAQLKESGMKARGLYCHNVVVLCLEGETLDWQHRAAAAGAGHLYVVQLSEYVQAGPLSCGFANGAECVIAGTPSIMIFASTYFDPNRNVGGDPQAWIHLVQQRINARPCRRWRRCCGWTARRWSSRTTPRLGPWWRCWRSRRRSSRSWSRRCKSTRTPWPSSRKSTAGTKSG